MNDTFPDLVERREHRLTVNLTRAEADQITRLAASMGARTNARVARALVIEGLQRRIPQEVAS